MGEVSRLRWVPPALAVALGLLALGAVLVDLVGPMVLHQAVPGGPVATWLITLAVTLPCTAVGVLLAARRPANPIGWLLLTLLLLTADPTDVYAILDYRLHHGTLPLGWVAVLFIGGPLVTVLMAILLWLFPDGRLPAGRWHRVSVVLVTAGLLVGIATTVGPGLTAVADHDVHIDANGNLYPVSAAWTVAGNVTSIAALASMLGWLALQVPRYRRSAAERRQQLKWLYSGAAVFVTALLAAALVPYATGGAFGSEGQLANDTIELGSSVLLICIAIAVLKYRLYAIDRIISRVVSYLIIPDHHRRARRDVCRARAVRDERAAGEGARSGGGRDAGRGGAVQSAAAAGAARGGPPVQPDPVRRGGSRGLVQRTAAPYGGSRRHHQRAGEHGASRIRAGPRLGLVCS